MTAGRRPRRSRRLVERQLRKAGVKSRADPSFERFLELIEETYDDFDRHRQLNDRSNRLASAELAETIASLDVSERLFRSLARCSPNGIIYSDREGRCVYANDRASVLFGASEELTGTSWLDRVADEDRAVVAPMIEDMRHGSHRDVLVEHRIRRSTGEVVWVSTSASVVEDTEQDSITGWVALFEDITERKRYEQQLAALARNDALTQLDNRYSLGEKLDQMCEQLVDGERLAVAVIDLDRFKLINDTFGHEAGDQLLVSVARKLEQATRAGDIVARLGGDEFAFVCSLGGEDDVAELGQRLSSIVHGPVSVGGRTLQVGGSVGLAVAGPGESDPEELLRNADAAMYRAKRSSKVTCEVFDASLIDDVTRRFDIEGDVRVAVGEQSITLDYQPIVDTATGRVEAVEALARLHLPRRGSVAPLEFIEVAEDLGLIHQLGRQLLDQACEQLKEWCSRLPNTADLVMSVNVSGRQLADPEFPSSVRRALYQHGVSASQLMLEFRASALMEQPELTQQTLTELGAAGVRLAVDDFGDGPMSLRSLGHLPIEHLKIGQSLVAEIRGPGPHHEERSVIESIVDLASRFARAPIGVGVETAAQRDLLVASGCTVMQGHLIASPMSADDARLQELLVRTRTAGSQR